MRSTTMLQKLVSLLSGNLGLGKARSDSRDPDERSAPVASPAREVFEAGNDERGSDVVFDRNSPPAELSSLLSDERLADESASGPDPDFQLIRGEESIMQYDELAVVEYSEEQIAASKQKLLELMRHCAGVYGVIVHTVDGHDLLSAVTQELHSKKIATMTSSFLALGETIARESGQSFCQYAMLENINGRVVSLRINDILMMTCISSKDSNAGMLLSVGKRTADAISKIFAR